VSLGWALTIGARIVYPALLPQFRIEFGFGYTTTGVLIGLVWASYGLLQFPGGLLADLTSHRTALVSGVAVTAVGVSAVAVAPTLVAFVLATAVMGAGTGIYGPSRVAILSNTYPDYDSTAISVSQAAGNIGNAVLPVVAGVLSAYAGWRLGFGFLVPLLAVVGVGLRLSVPVTTTARQAAVSVSSLLARTQKALLTRPVYSGTGLLLLIMLVYQSLTGFLPTYLVDEKELAAATAATVYGGFFAAAVVVQLGAGLLADRVGIRPVIALCAGLSVPGFGILVAADGFVPLIGGVISLSCLLGCFPPAHAYTVGIVPESIQGTGYGIVRTVYIGCGAVGPVLSGLVADLVSFPAAILSLALLVVGIAALGWFLPPSASPASTPL
jgi:MFS family permease